MGKKKKNKRLPNKTYFPNITLDNRTPSSSINRLLIGVATTAPIEQPYILSEERYDEDVQVTEQSLSGQNPIVLKLNANTLQDNVNKTVSTSQLNDGSEALNKNQAEEVKDSGLCSDKITKFSAPYSYRDNTTSKTKPKPQPTKKKPFNLPAKKIQPRITRTLPVVMDPQTMNQLQFVPNVPTVVEPPPGNMNQFPFKPNVPTVVEPSALKNNQQQYKPRVPAPIHQQIITQKKFTQDSGADISKFSVPFSYPKGIPKSFLFQKSSQTPEPYMNNTNILQQQQIQETTSPLWQTNPVPSESSPNWIVNQLNNIDPNGTPLFVQTDSASTGVEKQAYSPSELYEDGSFIEDEQETSEPSDASQKRQSAFARLGPVTAQPKKPKLTINILCNSEQPVREVVDEAEKPVKEEYVPVHIRPNILESVDPIVMKYRNAWPWKRSINITKKATAGPSWTAMIMEREQMEEIYDKSNLFIQVSVKGYPESWTKEMLMDCILESLKGKSLIPCFIEFKSEECKFLVLRSRQALIDIHKKSFVIRKTDITLTFTIGQTDVTLNQIDFIPRLILRKLLSAGYDDECKLDLSYFTAKDDISHFIYYPLNQTTNQIDAVNIQSSIAWNYLTHLNLSNNRLTTLDGFNLTLTTPKLKHLDLSINCIQKLISLARLRELNLHSIKLEGNPLCNDYIDPDHYIKVLRFMFPSLKEIDDVPIKYKGDMPKFIQNYCPEDAKTVIEKFLQVYFPLLDSLNENRDAIHNIYFQKAVMTVTYNPKFRRSPIFRIFRNLFIRKRTLLDGEYDLTEGAAEIAKLICKWPPIRHDPHSFTVDVLHHEELTTIFKVSGILKLTSESLAEDEHLLSFSRTFVLRSRDGWEYKVANDMVYWEIPTPELMNNAFRVTRVKPKLNLEFEVEPDDNLKESLTEVFMNITQLDKNLSKKCLQQKNWNLRTAISHVVNLLKLDELDTLINS